MLQLCYLSVLISIHFFLFFFLSSFNYYFVLTWMIVNSVRCISITCASDQVSLKMARKCSLSCLMHACIIAVSNGLENVWSLFYPMPFGIKCIHWRLFYNPRREFFLLQRVEVIELIEMHVKFRRSSQTKACKISFVNGITNYLCSITWDFGFVKHDFLFV